MQNLKIGGIAPAGVSCTDCGSVKSYLPNGAYDEQAVFEYGGKLYRNVVATVTAGSAVRESNFTCLSIGKLALVVSAEGSTVLSATGACRYVRREIRSLDEVRCGRRKASARSLTSHSYPWNRRIESRS